MLVYAKVHTGNGWDDGSGGQFGHSVCTNELSKPFNVSTSFGHGSSVNQIDTAAKHLPQ